jgi:hypothetical integral membrane protein (TIGR02206 family)
VGTALLCLFARGRRGRRAVGVVCLVAFVITTFWPLLPVHFDWRWSLPLHLCDVNLLLAAVALLLKQRWAAVLTWYWGLGLSSQGLITPDLQAGPARPGFWLFWMAHGLIVAVSIYLVVLGLRPRWRDLGLALMCTFGYGAIMLLIDLMFDLNYGYVGNASAAQPSAIDLLGDWPLRLVWMGLGVTLLFTLLTLPFRPWRAEATATAWPHQA